MNWFEILVQALGVGGIIGSIISFQCKSHGKIMFFRSMNELLFGVQYVLLGAYTGAGMNFIGILRNTVFAEQVKRNKSTLLGQILFSVGFIIMVAFTWDGAKSLLIGVAKVASTFAYGCKNTLVMRLVILLTSSSWLIYNVLVGSLAGVLCEAFTLCSIVVALIRIATGHMTPSENKA